MKIIERAALAALRRIGPRASDDFARRAIYISSRPLVDRAMGRIADRRTVKVTAGPFRGLQMLRRSSGTAHLAKALGTYEAYLAPWIERLIAAKPPLVINLGCGDGYYLNGMARRLPRTRAIGYEMDDSVGMDALYVAEINRLHGWVDVRGEVTADALQADLVPGAVVICDIEGGELAVLNAPGLRDATMLVELHDHLVPGTTEGLTARFAATHHIEVLGQSVVMPPQYDTLPEIERLALVCEHRDVAQHWMLLTPR